MNNILFYPFKWASVKDAAFATKAEWITQAFTSLGYNVYCHPDMDMGGDCKDLQKLPRNAPEASWTNAKFVICNHATAGDLTTPAYRENCLFFKPVGPDLFRCSLDSLGFGSYSTPTYIKPDFENIPIQEVNDFFATTVQNWIQNKATKWGDKYFNNDFNLSCKDYALVLGQVPDDEVVTHQDFSNYTDKLLLVLEELCRVTDDDIVVKLHPVTPTAENVMNWPDRPERFSMDLCINWKKKIREHIHAVSPKIKVIDGNTSVHDLLPSAKYVILANSGSGYEAMMHRKPIISFGCPEYHWVTYDLRKLCDLWRAIDTDKWFNPEMSDKFLYWYMIKYCIYDEASTLRRVKELLEESKKKVSS